MCARCCNLKRVRRAINITRGSVLCASVEEAASAIARGRGLMGREALAPGAGLLIGSGPLLPMLWIHTFFMRFPIDLVFLGRSGRIIRLMPAVKPWRLTAPVLGAHSVLELEAGAAQRAATRAGDEVRFEDIA
jgi:uncharacterized membrane protein (UPF0127 family)